MTNGTENSRNFQKFPGKRTTGCPYIWFCTGNLGWIDRALKIWKTRPVVILIGRWKQWSLDGLYKKDTRRPREQICLPVDNWPLTTRARESNVQCVRGVLAAHLSKFQKRADLKENLSNKRDMASIESEMRWKDRYSSLRWFYEGIGTLGMISPDLFRFTLPAWLKLCSAFRCT